MPLRIPVRNLYSSVAPYPLMVAIAIWIGLAHGQDPRLNEIQVIGSHNSYHVAPTPEMMQLIGAASKEASDSIDYTHPPLTYQFEHQGIRQIELDVYADPAGGLYSLPIGRKILQEAGKPPGPDPNLNGILDRPGMKIIHSPGFDFASTVPTLIHALKEVRQWSEQHPHHVPILVLIELKESASGPSMVKPIPFDAKLLDDVDREIRSVFDGGRVLTPDEVRGKEATLREALASKGWPRLSSCRGKVFFALDNEGKLRDLYLEGHNALEGRMMFATVEPNHPAAGWMKINDPVRDFDRIQAMVKRGFLVRTRSDANTKQSRTNDSSQRDRAWSSGAQFVSTDYVVPDKRFSTYSVRFPGDIVARTNPLIGDRSLDGKDLEKLTGN